ncbi:MAG: ZIP family metal transporter [Nanoarchaeota archaeon]
MQTLYFILIATIINGLIAFAGASLFFINEKKLEKFLILFLSFETGALLGGVFFHFIPESLEEISIIKTTILTILGFIIFLSLEKFLHWHHCHTEKCHEHTFTYLLIYGDAIHNFIDGLIIASSFIISVPVGIITSSLIIAHELPQEISDFAVLIYGGFTKKKALIYNFLSQLTAIIGGVLGYFFLSIKDQAIFLIPISAGGFLYIAISDLIPEIFKEKDIKKIIINLIFIILGISLLISAKIFVE